MPDDACGEGAAAQHDEPGPSGDGSYDGTLASTLASHYIGDFDVPLKQIRLTSFARPINQRGLERVVESIQHKGWLPHAPPAIVVEREGLPNGEFTEDCIAMAEYKVLDGNHRLEAAKKIFGCDKAVRCRVHYTFGTSAMRLLGDCK